MQVNFRGRQKVSKKHKNVFSGREKKRLSGSPASLNVQAIIYDKIIIERVHVLLRAVGL